MKGGTLEFAVDQARRAPEIIADFERGVFKHAALGFHDFDECLWAATIIGENVAPALLDLWVANGCITREVLARLLPEIWQAAHHPERALSAEVWMALFRKAGFVSDRGQPAPTKPLRVWRGALHFYRRGMAWTTDREKAVWFATAFGLPSKVYTAIAKPTRVLALFDDRDEAEIVLDTRGMRIAESRETGETA